MDRSEDAGCCYIELAHCIRRRIPLLYVVQNKEAIVDEKNLRF